jgi:hypothetical protein
LFYTQIRKFLQSYDLLRVVDEGAGQHRLVADEEDLNELGNKLKV